MLGLSALTLFALGWLFVYIVSVNETEIVKMLAQAPEAGRGRFRFMRSLGLDDEPASVTFIVAFWKRVPLFLLTVVLWSISRGSIAVAAEIERGTLDLVLSRPVSRTAFLSSQVVYGCLGLIVLGGSLAMGTWVASHYNVLRQPPTFWDLGKPALNLAMIGLPIFGYTLLASTIDHVRWRPNLVGSVLTLGGLIAQVVAENPVFKDAVWKPWLDRICIFNAFDPVDAVTKMQTLNMHLAILSAVGLGLIAVAYVVFAIRDLPANG
jgi:ABC-2 type transport system permease protein